MIMLVVITDVFYLQEIFSLRDNMLQSTFVYLHDKFVKYIFETLKY